MDHSGRRFRDARSYLDNTPAPPHEQDVNTAKLVRDEVIVSIADMLGASKANLDGRQAALLSQDVRELLKTTVEKVVHAAFDSVAMVDTESGLKLPPQEREKYRPRGKASPSQFLRDVWADYLDAGLMYSGHLKRVDPALYNALNHQAKTALSPLSAKIGERELAGHFLENFGVLCAWHLKHIPADYARQTSVLRDASALRTSTAETKIEAAIQELTSSL